ncbi:MAG: glycosyltransferase family 4 protein [Planctomycetaceae bacterium]|nr:glycosyltransferase family 4 protein [Planctomycetaceae bacterium]
MNILYLTQFFDPEPTFIKLNFVKELITHDHHVDVLTGYPNYPNGKTYDGYKNVRRKTEWQDGIRIVRVPVYPSHDHSGLKRIINYGSFGLSTSVLGLFGLKPDIVFALGIPTVDFTLSLFRWFRRSKIVIQVQDLWPESVTESGMMRNKILEKILSWQCQAFYRKANGIVVISEGFKENLIARGIKPEAIEIVHNWCDEQSMRPAQFREKLPEEPFTILFAGNIGILQSLETVLEATLYLQNQNKNIRFRLIGHGVKVSELKNRAAELKLTNIEFIPPVPIDEISLEYDKVDALLIHLKDIKLFEITVPSKTQAYLYAGKPILCGVRGDTATLIEQARAGFCFEPENAESLANTAIKMSEMTHEQLAEMGQNGHEYYMKHLCFKKGVDKIDTFLRKVIGQ